MTITVGLRDLTHRTSALVRTAALGERVIVTDRGRPIADLVPHSDADARKRRATAITTSINEMLELTKDAEIVDIYTASDDVLADVQW